MAEKTYILDSSVAIKWFLQESDSLRALEIRGAFKERRISLAAPDLILYELANGMHFSKAATPQLIQGALTSFVNCGVQIISPRLELFWKAIDEAADQHITIYDSIFIALAKQLKTNVITADTGMAKAGKSVCILLKDFHI